MVEANPAERDRQAKAAARVIQAMPGVEDVQIVSQGEVEKLIPYLVSPDNTVPGVSNYYATTCRECAAGCGLIVEVRDGGRAQSDWAALRDAKGVKAHPASISRVLTKAGITYKRSRSTPRSGSGRRSARRAGTG